MSAHSRWPLTTGVAKGRYYCSIKVWPFYFLTGILLIKLHLLNAHNEANQILKGSFMANAYVTHLDETSHMSAEFVFRYGPKWMGGLILPILVLLHL